MQRTFDVIKEEINEKYFFSISNELNANFHELINSKFTLLEKRLIVLNASKYTIKKITFVLNELVQLSGSFTGLKKLLTPKLLSTANIQIYLKDNFFLFYSIETTIKKEDFLVLKNILEKLNKMDDCELKITYKNNLKEQHNDKSIPLSLIDLFRKLKKPMLFNYNEKTLVQGLN